MKTIFIHGGPGLSPVADEVFLSNTFMKTNIDIEFWSEPKQYSSDNPYNELCDSLVNFIESFSGRVNIIAHSAGCGFLTSILHRVNNYINKVCFLSPAIDTNYSGNRIIEVALDIYSREDQEKEQALRDLLPGIGEELDETRKSAILLGLGSNYFPQNFIEFSNFEKYFSYLVGDNAFNIENHFKVLQSVTKYKPSSVSSVPVLCFLGRKDPIFEVDSCKQQVNLAFENVDYVVLENCSHYPHIENVDSFLPRFLDFIG